jgi:dihydrofolate reductase
MSKFINSTYISLDGVIENSHLWPSLNLPSDPRAEQIQTDLLLACDAVLMGRRTYEAFAAVWPTRSGDPASDRINAMRKYVVSTTLESPEWNNTEVIATDVADGLAKLRSESGQDIVQYGFGPVTKLLLEHGLLDELRLWLYPQTIGQGEVSDLLFANATEAQFALADSTTLSNGITVLTYEMA